MRGRVASADNQQMNPERLGEGCRRRGVSEVEGRKEDGEEKDGWAKVVGGASRAPRGAERHILNPECKYA